MKKLLYIFATSIFALTSCRNDGESIGQPTQEMNFSISADEEQIVTSRAGVAIQNGEISSLYLLVFDQNGRFLSRHQALLVSNYGGYKVTLPMSSSKRIIHFVANDDWSSFSDVANLGKSETEIVPSLSVDSGVVGYWQRVEYSAGIAAGMFSQTISLLRNVAKVSVFNLTSGTNKITNLSFAMGDTFGRGTISPFNASLSMPFVAGAVTEVAGGTFRGITEATDFLTAGSPLITYERQNSTLVRPAYIIVKGFYQSSTTANTTVYSYYKIDITGATTGSLYDIERNNYYIVNLNSVTIAGYPTLAQAMQAPASNNTSSSIIVEKFTSVSSGVMQLNVETTSKLFTKGTQSFSISYSYIPDSSTGTVNNSVVTATLTQDPAKPVINGNITYNNTTGLITATTAAIPLSVTDIYTATITIRAGSLERKISLRLRQPYQLTNIFTDPTIIANSPSQPVGLHFTIPNSINASEFPMPIYISTKKLSPNFQATSGAYISLDFVSGEYRYKYMAQNVGEQIVYFNTNSESNTETITLSGDYLTNAPFTTTSAAQTALTNLNCTPNGASLSAQKGQPVTMTFTIPTTAGVAPPYIVYIETSKLAFQSSTTGTVTATASGYLYSTSNLGTQTLLFKTNTADSDEYLKIYGERYAAVGFYRLCTKMSFVNPRFDAVTGLAGSAVSMRVGLPSTYDFVANDNKCEIFIYTTQLEPATSNPSALVSVTHPQYGPGYKYTTTWANDQEIKFKTLYPYSYETVRVNSGSFNEALLLRNFAFTAAAFSAKPTNTNATTTMTLTITVPVGSIPTAGLVIKIDSQDILVAYPSAPTNLVRVGAATDATGYFEYTVTTAGTYNITFRNRVNTASVKQKPITISAPGFVTSANLN